MSVLSERAKRQIALLAGDDIEGEQASEIRRSIETCAEHRQQWVQMCGCLDVLGKVRASGAPSTGPSLWPVIEARLKPARLRRPQKFNGWVPALSMAAACIAMLVAGQMDGTAPQDAYYPQVQENIFAGGWNQLHRPVVDFSRSRIPPGTISGLESSPEDLMSPETNESIRFGRWTLGNDGQ